MRNIKKTKSFKKDYKRESKGQHKDYLDDLLIDVVTNLANDNPLDESYRDHALSNNWQGYRDCHLKPDLVLIYSNSDKNTLNLARLGSHSQLKI